MQGLPQGVFGYVYGGQSGVGMGYIRIDQGACTGRDSGGVTLKGTLKEAASGGGFVFEGSLTVPPSTRFVAGSSEQEIHTTHAVNFPLPRDFANGEPFGWANRYGPCSVMATQWPEAYVADFHRALEFLR
jgi:hypothetical protein